MHLIFYNFFLWLYKLSIKLIAPWNRKARLWHEGRKGLMGKLKSGVGSRESGGTGIRANDSRLPTNDSPLIWMHCASLGEFEQGRPLLENIRSQYPQVKILLTFFSPSGYEVRKDYAGADYIFYLPMDNKINAGKFLDIVQPDLVLWVKYEYWYYYLVELKKRKIPTLLVSGIFRYDQPFFKWYGRLHQYMLTSFTHLFVQTIQSKELLASIGFSKNITVSGDTRFDRVVEIAERFQSLPLIEQFCGNSPVIVAGSTWLEDELELDHYANTHPEIKFIIAPHEVDEEHLKEVEKLFQHTVRYSQLPGAGYRLPVTGNVLIIDNIGMLARLYKYATITYIGGGFGEDGVHNVLEAAVYGKPVVFGPVYEKYIEAAELVETGGALVAGNALDLEEIFDSLLHDKTKHQACSEAAKNYVYAKKGATGKVMQFIQEKRLLII